MPIPKEQERRDIEISESDLEITTMRMNNVESAVRLKHIPTGIQIRCARERIQHLNNDIAIKLLKVKLLAISQEQKCDEINAIRRDIVEAGWGAQIRYYVMQPYKKHGMGDFRC